MKFFLFLLTLCFSAPLLAGSYQDLQDDIDDLKSTIQHNEMNRMLDKIIERNNANSQSISKRKYFNGVCRLQWVNGYGLVEIPGSIQGQAIYMLESTDGNRTRAELYIDKAISKDGVKTLIDMHKQQIYQMCK